MIAPRFRRQLARELLRPVDAAVEHVREMHRAGAVGVVVVHVEHEPWCSAPDGGACTCIASTTIEVVS